MLRTKWHRRPRNDETGACTKGLRSILFDFDREREKKEMKFLLVRLAAAVLVISAASSLWAADYKPDKNHSTIGFSVPIMGGLSRVTGKFTDFQVTLSGDETDLSKGSVAALIKTASIDTGIADRDADLKSKGFFDAPTNPEISFQSRRIRKAGDHWEAIGPLTMHGVTKEIVLPFWIAGRFQASPDDKRPLIGIRASLDLDRRDWGIRWEHSALATFVGDVVTVEIALLVRAVTANP
jgi:polyisoprenoid-binding protein YceI